MTLLIILNVLVGGLLLTDIVKIYMFNKSQKEFLELANYMFNFSTEIPDDEGLLDYDYSYIQKPQEPQKPYDTSWHYEEAPSAREPSSSILDLMNRRLEESGISPEQFNSFYDLDSGVEVITYDDEVNATRPTRT